MIFIGIDPGESTGFAVWSSHHRCLIQHETIDFWTAIFQIQEYADREGVKNVTIVIEDPNLNKPVFLKKGVASHAAEKRVAQNVGMNKKEADLILKYCEKYGIPFESVRPTTKKWDANIFGKITGIKARTSQHVRDAVKLVWGR